MLIKNSIKKYSTSYAFGKIKYKKISLRYKSSKNKKSIFLLLNLLLLIIFIPTVIILLYKNRSLKENIQNLNYLLNEYKINADIISYNNISKFYNKTINYTRLYEKFRMECTSPQLKEIYPKMTFEQRLPLPEEIKCEPHLYAHELIPFLSLLTNNTVFFENGSGCSSVIAKYYAKKTYAIEGTRYFINWGIKNGLKDVLIFKNLKPRDYVFGYPGPNTNLNDWKEYFTAYKAEYNADVILIDGRFKVATAMDIFNKIRNDTIVLIHEYNIRPIYFIIEKYYKYIYHWLSLSVFIKRTDISEIPIEIQKKYWTIPV